jgi:hypothetical protein
VKPRSGLCHPRILSFAILGVASGENIDQLLDEWRLSGFKEVLPQHRPRVMDEGDDWLACE